MTTNDDESIAFVIEVTATGATIPEAERAAARLARNIYGRACMKPWTRSVVPLFNGHRYRVRIAWVVCDMPRRGHRLADAANV